MRGQRTRLGDVAPSSFEVGVAISSDDPIVFDFSCFGVDGDGILSDDRYLVFYNQRRSPEGEIEALGPRDGDDETFGVDLDRLPPHVRKLAFTITVDLESEGTMAAISSGHLRLLAGGKEVARYPFAGADFGEERSLILAEIYHKDAWRFAAVGQGFDGDLRALLKHYGGEEVPEETPRETPETAPAPSPVPPPAPSGPPVRVEERGALQRTIDEAAPGATLSLGRDEYEGPIQISKPLTLEGETSVVWARRGPVVTVGSPGVALRNLSVEVTILDGGGDSDDADVALKLAGGAEAALEEVSVRGRVVGLGTEGGAWRLPLTLDLGVFAPRSESRFVVGVSVPVACRFESKVAGITVEPGSLSAGEHDVTLVVRDVPADALLSGNVEVRSPHVTRAIAVTGGTVNAAGSEPASDVRLWG